MADRQPESDSGSQRRHWDTVSDYWPHLGPPLRPSEADIAVMQAALRAAAARLARRPFRALLLGVTHAIASMEWPAKTDLLAIDRSAEMLAADWPGDVAGLRRAECGDWMERLPALSGLQAVFGDGSYNTLTYPAQMTRLSQLVHRATAPDAALVLRTFVAPEHAEQPRRVLADLAAGNIGNFHVAKFRLAMSLIDPHTRSVALDDVWRAWRDAGIDEAALAADSGWSPATIATIGMYRDSPGRLHFPTLQQVRALLDPLFELESSATPDYEMGDRCPTLVLRRR